MRLSLSKGKKLRVEDDHPLALALNERGFSIDQAVDFLLEQKLIQYYGNEWYFVVTKDGLRTAMHIENVLSNEMKHRDNVVIQITIAGFAIVSSYIGIAQLVRDIPAWLDKTLAMTAIVGATAVTFYVVSKAFSWRKKF